MAAFKYHPNYRDFAQKRYWNVGNIHKSMQTALDCSGDYNYPTQPPQLNLLYPQDIIAAPIFIDRNSSRPILSYRSNFKTSFKRTSSDKKTQTSVEENLKYRYTKPQYDEYTKYTHKFERKIGRNLIKRSDQISSVVVLTDNYATVLGNLQKNTQLGKSRRHTKPAYVKLAKEIHKTIGNMTVSDKRPKKSVKSVIVVNVDDDSSQAEEETSDYGSTYTTANKRSSTGFVDKVRKNIVCEVLNKIDDNQPAPRTENSSRKRWSIFPLNYFIFNNEEENDTANSEANSVSSEDNKPPKSPSPSFGDDFRNLSASLATTIVSIPTVSAREIPGQDCVPQKRKKCRKCKDNSFCCKGKKCEFVDPVMAIQRSKCKKSPDCLYLAERSNLCPKCPPPATCAPNTPLNCSSCDRCGSTISDMSACAGTKKPTKEQCRACETKRKKKASHVHRKSQTPSYESLSERPEPIQEPRPQHRRHRTPPPPPCDASKYEEEEFEFPDSEKIAKFCSDVVSKGKDLATPLFHQVCTPLNKPDCSGCPRKEPPPEDPCCEIKDTFDRLMCRAYHEGTKAVTSVVKDCGSYITPREVKKPLPTVNDVTKKVVETIGSVFCATQSEAPSTTTSNKECKPKPVGMDHSEEISRATTLYNTIKSAITDIFGDSGSVVRNSLMTETVDLTSSSIETVAADSHYYYSD